MNTQTSTGRPLNRTGSRPQSLSEACSAAIGAAAAMFLVAVALIGLSIAVEAAWMSATLGACALASMDSGAGLIRASEWSRVAGSIVCIGTALGAIFVFRAWTPLFSLGALGVYLSLPSTKLALQGVRARALARAEKH